MSGSRSCNELRTLRTFVYPVGEISACGGNEAAVTSRTSFECVWDSGELLCGKKFALRLKGTAYDHGDYVRK